MLTVSDTPGQETVETSIFSMTSFIKTLLNISKDRDGNQRFVEHETSIKRKFTGCRLRDKHVPVFLFLAY